MKYNPYVNSVENFICPFFQKVKKAVIFGYPGDSYHTAAGNEISMFPTASKINLPENIYGYFEKDSMNIIDSSGCFFEVDNFMKDYESLGGFSGSPVFLQDSITKKIRITGIFTGNGINPNGRCAIWFTPIEFALRRIEEMN
jgi:hypothetical protein